MDMTSWLENSFSDYLFLFRETDTHMTHNSLYTVIEITEKVEVSSGEDDEWNLYVIVSSSCKFAN